MAATSGTVRARWVGDCHMLVTIDDDAMGDRARDVAERIRHADVAGVVDVVPTLASVLLVFDPVTLDPDRAMGEVLAAAGNACDTPVSHPTTIVEIPVCYGGPHGPDLEDVAALHGVSTADVIAAHASAAYTVGFIGFSPGFPYLVGLPSSLETARLASPRPRVEPGSVGIAGSLTGIYPGATPGGWRLIGQTPLHLFDARRTPPNLLSAGDGVRFVPIDAAEFERRAREGR